MPFIPALKGWAFWHIVVKYSIRMEEVAHGF